jgi:hypothetical protein
MHDDLAGQAWIMVEDAIKNHKHAKYLNTRIEKSLIYEGLRKDTPWK